MPYYPPRPPEPVPKESDPKEPASMPGKTGSGKRILRWALLCVSALLMIYGGTRLFSYYADLNAAKQATRELREAAAAPDSGEETGAAAEPEAAPAPETAEIRETAAETESAPEQAADAQAAETPGTAGTAETKSDVLPAVNYPNGYQMNSRILKLRKKNEYVIGWITMDDLDEPVVMKDNTFFLTHDASGRKNVNGAIFMDEGTPLLTRPYTIMLFGHNMKTGAMFGNLRKYEDFSYYYHHRNLRFDTLYEEGEYVVFAVETISVTAGKSRFVNLAAIESTNRKIRREALDSIIRFSLHSVMPDVNEEDQILLLITCVGDEEDRLILAARRLREGEAADRVPMITK